MVSISGIVGALGRGLNDVIFCPVDINSHNACQMVKDACKMRNKPCYFLRSSGLSALKKVISGFEPGYGKIYGG